MRDSDTVPGLMTQLEQTLDDARRRLADLCDLCAAPARGGLESVVEVLAPLDCAPELPAELTLPQEVDAPAVVVLPDAEQAPVATSSERPLSVR